MYLQSCQQLFQWLAAVAVVSLLALPAAADPIADFYHGKTLTIVTGNSAGGDYDNRARLVARHIGHHIPGEPSIIVRNMPGAGGVAAANWLAKLAPKDGTALYLITQNLPSVQALRSAPVEFDVRAFQWIGNTTDSPNVITVWSATGIRTIEDAKQREVVLGASGAGSASYYYPATLNALVGTKFKIVPGYPGGNELNLAMERGEVGGRGSQLWAAWKSTRPEWLRDNKITILVQIGLKRAPDLPDVPLMFELANNDDDRVILRFLSSDTALARAFVTTPETPPERVAALRRAFDATMKDPQFLAEANQAKIDISPVDGEQAQEIATSIVNTAPAALERVKAILQKSK